MKNKKKIEKKEKEKKPYQRPEIYDLDLKGMQGEAADLPSWNYFPPAPS